MAEMKENMAPATAPPARTSDIAVIGLAVMGQNLILNMNDNGFVVTAYNRTTAKVDEFLANEAKGTKIVGAHSIEEMCATLKAPRRIMLLVKAGAPVDQFIEAVLPHTEPGDILIDGGNSLFSDTIRRTAHVEAQGRLFIGTGVSGGEEGARHGPSISEPLPHPTRESQRPLVDPKERVSNPRIRAVANASCRNPRPVSK